MLSVNVVNKSDTAPAASPSFPNRTSQQLLHQRGQGRISPWAFMDGMLNTSGTTTGSTGSWRVSTSQIRPASRSATTALALCDHPASKYLLVGTKDGHVAIYDLWETPTTTATVSATGSATAAAEAPSIVRHAPIQQALVTTSATGAGGSGGCGHGGSITAVQWYPVDTGIFLTASAAGTLTLWDSTAMVPVLQVKPFCFTELSSSYTLRCMDASPFNGTLVATGSNGSTTIQLVDLSSGAASHALTPPSSSSRGSRGVTAVQWSPSHTYTLASCGGGRNVYIWDIRRTKQPLATLDDEYRPKDATVSRAFCDGVDSYWKQPNQRASSSVMRPASATNLCFTETGQHLVTVCGARRELAVWDLCASPDAPVRLRQSFATASGGKAIQNSTLQPLIVTAMQSTRRRREQSTWIWVSSSPTTLDAYDIALSSTTGGGGGGRGTPVATLRGHLGHIAAAVAATNKATPRHIITAANDGLVLAWDPPKRAHRCSNGSGRENNARTGHARKRSHDVDTW
jgi:DNA excision repair protein ERCC-8